MTAVTHGFGTDKSMPDRRAESEGAKVGKESRSLLYYDDDQDQQAQGMLIQATGDGVSVENEEELLGESFGAPNADGIYGAPDDAPEGNDD